MDDNARPHRALIVREYLNEVGIHRLVWPARSPDFNGLNIFGISSNDVFNDEILLLRTWLNRKTRIPRRLRDVTAIHAIKSVKDGNIT
ncbi:hypothetical protein D910_08199 [Dendroctonus ponderosae]|uniref:Tc1-like transposase DDE domain-containing protein n=1 Tax=Dendroctonus ponderosae TaxID=77166 RepID=U4UAD3_DENPD|nr:hypothetical protein D910_08199 [Dendroctonus ponderosae]